VFSFQCKPVEEYYRAQDKVLDFDILGGIPETWPKLLEAVKPYLPKASLAVATA
jgi:adenylate kinase